MRGETFPFTKKVFCEMDKNATIICIYQKWALTIGYKSSNKASWRCILLSFINPNNFFHISINHFNNPMLKTQMFNICTSIFSLWNTTKISLNFNSMKIYSHGFVVPTLEYKISIFILNLFLVTYLQQTFYNPNNKWNTIWTIFLGHSSLPTLELTFLRNESSSIIFVKGPNFF